MTALSNDAAEIVLRPPALGRFVGWLLAVFGVIFGASGFAGPEDHEALVVMLLAGVAVTVSGLALATSRARVNRRGITYRNGLHRAHVPATEIVAFGLGPGSGARPPRVTYVVFRRGRRPLRLIGIQRWNSAKSRAKMTDEAGHVRALLGLPPSAE